MRKIYKVYRYTFPNGKIYIGITRQTLAERKSSGYYHNAPLQAAIREYGWENIFSEILYDHLTKKQALKMEAKMIKFYSSADPYYGYNIIRRIRC